MRATMSPEKFQQRSVSATTFTPGIGTRQTNAEESNRLSSPKNFKFFGKLKTVNSRGVIHSHPTTESPIISPNGKGLVHTQSIADANVWLFENNETTHISSQKSMSESTKFKNIDALMKEDKLFSIPEAAAKMRKKEAEAYTSLPTELRSKTEFKQIFSNPETLEQTIINSTAGAEIRRKRILENSPKKKIKMRTSQGFFQKEGGDSQFYGLEQIGYSNYKYKKIGEVQSAKNKKVLQSLTANKETIENCIQNIHNQKILIENIKNQEDIYTFSPSDKMFEEAPIKKVALVEQPVKNIIAAQTLSPIKKLETVKSTVQTWKSYDANETLELDKTTKEEKEVSPIMSKKHSKAVPNPFLSSTSFKFISNKGFVPDLKRIMVNKKQSFNMKQLKMEFEYYSEISQKYLEDCKQKFQENVLNQNEYYLYKLNQAIREKGICVHVLLETQLYLKSQKKTIVDRVLLALGVNLTGEFPTIGLSQFQILKRVLIHKDLSNSEMVDFIIRFFKLEEQNLNKNVFLRILRSLIDKVDGEGRQASESNELYETFIENYNLTGIFTEENDFVDFNRFRQIYLFNKMNILDLVDLIAGVN